MKDTLEIDHSQGLIQPFHNEQLNCLIEVVEIEGEHWFVAKDILSTLDLNRSSIANLDEDEKGVHSMYTPGGTQQVSIINESGLYSLILRSRKPEAKRFKKWVTSEVLPAIRKHGAYATPSKLEDMLNDPDTMIKTLQVLKDEREKRQSLEAKVALDKPKVIFADAVSASKTSILVGELAKIMKQNGIEIGGTRLFKWLRNSGYLIKGKRSDYNMPTQRSMEMGLFEVKETSITHSDGHVTVSKTPKVTGKGQQYFINLFLNGKEAA